ncbi:MAG: tetratricopeptide repeat protein [Propionibacteriaceae bacterium]|nr:tetratricopeptide repeat protein [Propionibacteriaceae bacterium]
MSNAGDDLLNEVDDDIVSSRRAKTVTATEATKAGRGSDSPASSGELDQTKARGGLVAGLPWVLVAVLVGIIIGMVWMVGRPTTAPSSSSSATEPVATETVDPAILRAEMEARIAVDPNDADAHLQLGVLLFNQDDMDGAKAEWDKVLAIDPTSTRAWYNLGFWYLYQTPSDNAKAKEAWNKVIELDPQSDLASSVEDHMSAITDPSPSATTGG